MVLAAGILPYCAAVTPVRAQVAADAVGRPVVGSLAQGSMIDSLESACARNSAWPLGARPARLTVPRRRTRSTGAQSTPKLYALADPCGEYSANRSLKFSDSDLANSLFWSSGMRVSANTSATWYVPRVTRAGLAATRSPVRY